MKIPNLVLSTIILFLSNIVVRILGFLYKVFLSRTIGETGLGMYCMLFNFLMMCIAFTTTGIPTALSCLVANKKALHDKHSSNVFFISTLYISFFMALIISLLVSFNSKYLSFKFLKDSNLTLFVLAICPAIILITISNILRAYYYGLEDVVVPAIGQIIEQVVRILFVFLVILYINNKYLSCYIALLGISVGEIANILFMTLSFYKNSNIYNKYTIKLEDFYYASLETIKMSVPITCNRMSSILINSISSIIIPSRLTLSGITYGESLRVYGILSGMVIPFIYLPLTLGSALVVNLIPSISQELTLNKYENIKKKIKYSLLLSFFVGSFCSFLFYFFSNHLCLIMFNNKLAGIYLKSMFLAPLFISLNQTLSGILQAIRKEFLCSIITISGMVIQLLSIYILIPIPTINIYAYIHTITLVSVFTCLLHAIVLVRALKFLNIRRLK
ncbi:polysaccharide biosynthesis protein [Romboutsia sp.]|uniref:polysaccharide biosynthesis protein n=1 Tax=Romboutsia sp. TaxID=1965302 RepID=UPI003F34927B